MVSMRTSKQLQRHNPHVLQTWEFVAKQSGVLWTKHYQQRKPLHKYSYSLFTSASLFFMTRSPLTWMVASAWLEIAPATCSVEHSFRLSIHIHCVRTLILSRVPTTEVAYLVKRIDTREADDKSLQGVTIGENRCQQVTKDENRWSVMPPQVGREFVCDHICV